MKKQALSLFFITLFFISACHLKRQDEEIKKHPPVTIIDLQPFSDVSNETSTQLWNELKKILPDIRLRQPIPVPMNAWYAPRQRFRADSIINFLDRNTINNHVTIGITTYDISTTKNEIQDWGIMGLGFSPGKACVVSSFRLTEKDKSSQLFKVAIHELGHTQGLPHCEVKYCFMRDADGHNTTNEETAFCERCKKILVSKGWNLK